VCSSDLQARLAEQQAAIRRQLEDLQSRLKGNGTDASKELREIQQQMDRNETDIVNRRLSAEMLRRQQEILTRLLQAEKSLREQEQDNKRASNVGKDMPRPLPPELQQFLRQRQQLLESYHGIPPQLKPYYRQMVDAYFRNIGAR
jgi:chromosome segregation ATPase